MPSYRTHDVGVEGGTLRVGAWGQGGPVVLAAHGLTANHISFEALAEQLGDDFRLIAPDLRGRGRSRDIEGPWGVNAHVADLDATLDHLTVERADVVIGHSMGAFVAAVAAARSPERYARVVFIDGGFPPTDLIPDNVAIEPALRAAVGPSLQRLDMTFPSRQAYLDFWRPHPAFANDWSVYAEHYFDYDLIGTEPKLVSSVKKEAVLRDAETQMRGDLVPRALESLRQPVRFIKAARGLTNGAPLYSEGVLNQWGSRIAHFSRVEIADVNHFTIVMSLRGARALALDLRRLLQQPGAYRASLDRAPAQN